MSPRVTLSVAAGALVLAAGAGAFALAHADEQPPALGDSAARYTAPRADRDGSLTFTTDVTASSGVKSVKVLAWPENSSFAEQKPTAKDMAAAESATCEPTGDDSARCTYTVPVTATDADASPNGRWHIAVLATEDDGSSTLAEEASGFTVE
ncbi:DUF5707 domain-containing protein [Streptomyces pseudogriseolus]|uniref:DUF5707 domain-containing protein n=1 Tax=Streptomyces pseudogriseolus TaxID=36817 RepID=UPI003FA2757F